MRSVARVHQHGGTWQTGRATGTKLIARDLDFGLKPDLPRHAGLRTARRVRGPRFRQIQPIGHRQAGMRVGNRKRDCDLAIVLLAELTTILSGYTDRMAALLRKAGIVDDPGLDRPTAQDHRQHHLPHFGQHLLIRPATLADKVQQRLMLRRGSLRRRHRSDRFHALASAGHQQPRAIIPKRPRPVRVADHADKTLNVSRKARFDASRHRIHLSPRMPKVNPRELAQ